MDDLRFTGLIYEGAGDAQALARSLKTFARRVRAVGAGLAIQDMTTHQVRVVCRVGVNADLTPTYERLAHSNVILQDVVRRKRPLADHMVLPKSEFERTELYAEWFAPQRFRSVLAAPVFFENDAVAVIAAFRDARRGDFEPEDLAQAERFAGHFGAALQWRLARERDEAELEAVNFILDELPDPIFLVSRTRRLRHANAAGKRVLASRTPFRADCGRLECCKPNLTDRLERLIAAAKGELRVPAQAAGSWIIQVHASGGRSLAIGSDHVTLRIVQAHANGEALDAAKLRERLGLSARQAESIHALVECGAEGAAATKLGIGKTTLHTHVLRVYDHLGVRNRAGLLALLAGQGFDVGLRNEIV